MAWHKNLKPIQTGWRVAFYLTKAKLSGVLRGQKVSDYCARKRLLFKPKLGLQKYGTIGPFWEKPKKQLWKEIAEEEKKIAESLKRPDVRRLVDHMYHFFGETISIKELERDVGSDPDAPAFQRWMEQLALDDDQTIE